MAMHQNHPTLVTEDAVQCPVPSQVDVAGNQLTLFAEWPPLMQAMLDDILAARSRVWMEVYIFAPDAAGQALADAFIDRAKAGVDVRLMVDAWGSFSLPNSHIKRMRAAGVQVEVFHDLTSMLHGRLKALHVLNQRNHRKLLIVDDTIAYFGGMNVVDQTGLRTPADAKRRHLPSSAGWRDVHVRLVGPAQRDVAAIMERLWRKARGERVPRVPKWPLDQILSEPGESLHFFDTRPTFKRRRPSRVLVPLIRRARREITLSVAYFLPVGRVFRELVRARRRGVRVQVIVPGQNDVRIVQWACRHYYEFLLKRGIRIYERSDRMLHSKAMTVDDRWSVIGSCNFDARSLLLNLEFMALIQSPAAVQALERIFAEDIRDSVRVTHAYCRRRSWWQRLRDRAAWSLRKWL